MVKKVKDWILYAWRRRYIFINFRRNVGIR